MMIGSLFSGIGGLELGLERAGVGHTVWQCEQDTAAQAVLRRHWPGLPIYDDVRKIGAANVGPVDVLCGGFPCQDISLAGSGAGLEGARSGLWFEYLRTIRELRPRYVVAENVAALRSRGLDVVLGGLAESGYDSLWFTLRASDVGAPHRRERLFIVAWRSCMGDTDGTGLQVRRGERCDIREQLSAAVGASGTVADTDGQHADRAGHGAGDVCGRRPTPAEVRHGDPLADRDRTGCLVIEQDGQGRDGLRRGARGHDAHRRGATVHEWPPGPNDGPAWGEYLRRFPRRAPALRHGRLNPCFVEALMGFPENWTRAVMPELGRDVTRNDRLRMLGNAVVPQCGEVVGHVLGGLP